MADIGRTAAAFERAAERLRAQLLVPRSPGLRVDGDVQLCAGAAVVVEAQSMRSTVEDAAALAESVLVDGHKRILEAAVALGLHPTHVAEAIISNDSVSDAARQDTMPAWLEARAETLRATSHG